MTSTIIRATDQNRGVPRVAFNFDDIAAQAKRYLDDVRAEALKIVAAAQQEAENAKRQAEAKGRAVGAQAIEQLVQERLAQQVATLLPALRQSVTQVQHAKQAWLSHWEKAAVHVATLIAGRVIRRELSQQPEIALDLVREALELAAGSAQVRIHLHPADHQSLGPQVQTVVREFASLGTAELIADPQVTPGGCRVETQFGVIDQQIESQLARIEEELT